MDVNSWIGTPYHPGHPLYTLINHSVCRRGWCPWGVIVCRYANLYIPLDDKRAFMNRFSSFGMNLAYPSTQKDRRFMGDSFFLRLSRRLQTPPIDQILKPSIDKRVIYLITWKIMDSWSFTLKDSKIMFLMLTACTTLGGFETMK